MKAKIGMLKCKRIKSWQPGWLLTLIVIFSACGKHSEHQEEESDHHEHGIELGTELKKEFGIEDETITPGKFHHVIKVGGQIESSSSDINTVTAKQSGIVTLSSDINL